MSASEALEALPLPSHADWMSIGLTRGPELHAGYQSRVFRSSLNGDPIVVKLSDSRLVGGAFSRRAELLASVSEVDLSVVGPVPIRSGLVHRLGQWLVVAYPYVAGEHPDVTIRGDVIEMASTLAELHHVLAQHRAVDLPAVAAIRDHSSDGSGAGFGPAQLLHGDFSSANTLRVNGRLRVFDFDDCGYGPVEFEVGNTLYMVLFDAWLTSNLTSYERFREWFVETYRSESGRPVVDAALDAAIEMRVSALDRWLTNPERAPIGIRTATPEWRDRLRVFVESTLPADGC